MPTELPTDMNGSARTPTTNHLFNVNPVQRNCLRLLPNNFITWWQNYCIYQDVPDKTFKPRSHFFIHECNRLTRMTMRNLLGWCSTYNVQEIWHLLFSQETMHSGGLTVCMLSIWTCKVIVALWWLWLRVWLIPHHVSKSWTPKTLPKQSYLLLMMQWDR